MITEETIEELKNKVDIVDFISGYYVDLEGNGDTFYGLCPFHDNTDTPAMAVWKNSQRWHCFGECNQGGDIIDFVQQYEGINFYRAVEHIIKSANLDIKLNLTAEELKKQEEKKALVQVMEDASKYFHKMLAAKEGVQALEYLRTYRKVNNASIRAFRLGYAPEGTGLIDYLLEKGHLLENIIKSGLANRNGGGKIYPTLKRRVIFPIFDSSGNVRAFGGRDLVKNSKAKYINTANTPIFTKGNSVYGLYQGKTSVRNSDYAIVVEGYLDVIVAHQSGFENVVSVLGTAMTAEQARMISYLTNKIFLAFDPDSAGNKAALKGAQRVEQETKCDVYVVSLPDQRDPDELILEDAGLFSKAVWEAQPLVIHMAEHLIEESGGILDPKGKRDIANQLIPIIENVEDPTEQIAYKEWLAKRLGFEKYRLTVKLPDGERREV